MVDCVEVTTLIGAPPERVFDLELDVDVHTASMEESKESASTLSGRRQLALHDEVTFTARHFGLCWRLTSRITEYERPLRFVDEQVVGPFRHMRHEHLFEEVTPNLTRMTDRMTATLPLGFAGDIAARLVLRPYLRRLLRQRGVHIKQTAEGHIA